MYVVANSEVTKTTCEKWFGLYGDEVHGVSQSINLYTGIEIRADGNYNNKCQNEDIVFYPVYETLYSWLKDNEDGDKRKIVFACHEIPFTVITQASLSNSDDNTMGYTRNYPNGSSSLLGSHMNQLDATENRGTYWASRLLEHFGCKLCIGGHKHTYALSYPIKENYQWKDSNGNEYSSLDNRKPMLETLEDECGTTPVNAISWDIKTQYDANDNPYNVSSGLSGEIRISSTKLPYIPNDLFSMIGANRFYNEKGEANTYYYRCCTPIDTSTNTKYDGFVNYSMCQATGYKLKSNKELPCAFQVFSKLIPMTTNEVSVGSGGTLTFKDTVNGNQLYPMFSVLEFENDKNGAVNAINVKMCRVAGIFAKDGKDSFTQTSYGKKSPSIQYLLEVNPTSVENIVSIYNSYYTSEADAEKRISITPDNYMYGVWVTENMYNDLTVKSNEDGYIYNKYLYIQY